MSKDGLQSKGLTACMGRDDLYGQDLQHCLDYVVIIREEPCQTQPQKFLNFQTYSGTVDLKLEGLNDSVLIWPAGAYLPTASAGRITRC